MASSWLQMQSDQPFCKLWSRPRAAEIMRQRGELAALHLLGVDRGKLVDPPVRSESMGSVTAIASSRVLPFIQIGQSSMD